MVLPVLPPALPATAAVLVGVKQRTATLALARSRQAHCSHTAENLLHGFVSHLSSGESLQRHQGGVRPVS